jgi:hypothetical protein
VTLAEAHIVLQAKLRGLTATAVARCLGVAPGPQPPERRRVAHEGAADRLGAQRQSVHLTEAYLARALERQPIGVDVQKLIGAERPQRREAGGRLRRPFITDLGRPEGAARRWLDALHAGGARATSTAAMDVQLSMRATLVRDRQADDAIVGYRRVPDGGACASVGPPPVSAIRLIS